MREGALYLRDILDAMDAIERFVEGLESEALRRNDMVSSAVIRKLEVIGEAAKRVPEEVKSEYPQVPWKEMAGMRDRLIHFYFGVKHDLLWHTIKDVIPRVRPALQEALSKYGPRVE